jgi:hypothetical protein
MVVIKELVFSTDGYPGSVGEEQFMGKKVSSQGPA